jgi:hypothetical protein
MSHTPPNKTRGNPQAEMRSDCPRVSVIQDTLRLSRQLQELGFDQRQADGLVSALSEELAEGVASKQDVCDLKHDLAIAVRDLKIWTGLVATAATLAGVGIFVAFIR